jgi:diamine N-acetyltransferase
VEINQSHPILLRHAVFSDRRRIYDWLIASEASPWIMGPPAFPDYPASTWEKFCADYSEHFFLPEGDGYGRMFMISAEGREIGFISYYGLNNWNGFAELDICVAASSDYPHEPGSYAIRLLSDELFAHPTVEGIIVRPSRRNARAIAACRKAGFVHYDSRLHRLPGWAFSVGLDYSDPIILLRLPA